jgi:hypothetical protein
MYIQLEHANIATLDVAQEDDPVAVTLSHRGEDVLAMQVGRDPDPDRWNLTAVGKLTEIRDELWFALDPAYIAAHPVIVMRAARATDDAFRAAGWDV